MIYFSKHFPSILPAAKPNISKQDWIKFENNKIIFGFDQNLFWTKFYHAARSDVKFLLNQYLSKW